MLRTFATALVSFIAASVPVHAQELSFEDWRTGFSAQMLAQGVDQAIVASMLDGIEPDLTIVERDRSQPEFVRPIWTYIEGAASPDRIAGARRAEAEHGATLAAVEDRFGVDASILTAIWGLESAFGAIQGNNDVVRALATLAWEGRRRGFAEAQLFAVAEMLENGYATREELRGSWAGAMGQTQFIPTTYMETAVDFDGDGHRDIWSNTGDALGSAANLLLREGWQTGQPVVVEVSLPEDFDYGQWDPMSRRPVASWALSGIHRNDEGEWRPDTLYLDAKLVIPAGAGGPAFLTFRNFDALMGYNNSTAYGLGVSYLAKALEGGPSIRGAWPLDNLPINYAQSIELQQALTDLGYDTGGVDGVVGPNTRRALRAFQLANGIPADGYAAGRAYAAVMAARAAQAGE